MGIKAKDFAIDVETAYVEQGGYIWGKSGELWTETKQKNLEKTTDEDRKLSRVYGTKWIGHHVWDCSGLPYDKLKKLGIKIPHGCNSIWRNSLSHKGKITKGLKLPIGAAIFTGSENDHPHMGTLITETCVTEAKGAQNGVVHTPLSNKKWTYWGLYKGVDYDFIPGETTTTEPSITVEEPPKTYNTLKIKYRGSDVKYMQELLLKAGESLPKYGADGQFGNETLKAVKSFQKKHGLVVDGICGKMTWSELIKFA